MLVLAVFCSALVSVSAICQMLVLVLAVVRATFLSISTENFRVRKFGRRWLLLCFPKSRSSEGNLFPESLRSAGVVQQGEKVYHNAYRDDKHRTVYHILAVTLSDMFIKVLHQLFLLFLSFTNCFTIFFIFPLWLWSCTINLCTGYSPFRFRDIDVTTSLIGINYERTTGYSIGEKIQVGSVVLGGHSFTENTWLLAQILQFTSRLLFRFEQVILVGFLNFLKTSTYDQFVAS